MSSLLRSLPVAVLAMAALESSLVRLELDHRPTEPALFLQAVLLWGVFGLLACVPAWLTLRVLELRRSQTPDAAGGGGRSGPWAPAVLVFWMLAPVVAHAVLDRHTGLAGSVGGLASLRPWVEVLLAGAGLVLLLALAAFVLRRVPGRALAAAVVVAAAVVGFFLPPRSAAGPPEAGPGPAAGRPNLLLLVWDTCRSDRLEPYGFERPTSPALERLAEECVLFEDSISSSVFTFTSHLTLLTGLYPSSHGARMLRMRYDPRRGTSIAAILREAGYRTGAFVGTDVLAGRTGLFHGFEVYDDQVDPPVCATHAWGLVHDVQSVLARAFPALRNDGRPHWFQDFQRPAEEVLERALEWIQSDDPRPWFCLVNLYDVHWPYVPDTEAAAELVTPYDGPLDGFVFRSDSWVEGTQIADEDRRHVAELYEAEIRELDRTVSGFLGALALERGGTAVVVTSDHGEAFGEAGRWYHDDVLEPQVRVPLLVRPPDPSPAGRRVAFPASGVDVAPTLLALAGLEPPEGVQGVDLLSEAAGGERLLFVEDRDHPDPRDVRVALYRGRFKLVRTGVEEEVVEHALYDLERDPLGEHDVRGEHPELFEELVRLLEEHRPLAEETGAPWSGDAGAADDALRALGYAGED